ncbi:MAG: type 2 isopentenyl-diphosphate Delta-isomerase [Myxococcota bacterium]
MSSWGEAFSMPAMAHDISERKADHLDLCATDEVAYRRKTTLLEQVGLVHQSLPDLDLDAIDLSVTLLGKRLSAPIVIASMTGGHERAADLNRTLASIAEEHGYAIGLGSQRAMLKRPDTAHTFYVRDEAPTALLFGNVGIVQARDLGVDAVRGLVEAVGADALCLHMNPAQELIQPEGDRDFRGGRETMAKFVDTMPVPIIGKETGNGISAETAMGLREAGVRVVDTSGAGGTSWVGVETLRAVGGQKALGELLWDWGVPTAASVINASREGLTTIATGGMQNGLDAARAIALGASAAGFARGVFMALQEGGRDGAVAFLKGVEQQLRAVMLLCGAKDIAALQAVPRMLGPDLQRWADLGEESPPKKARFRAART